VESATFGERVRDALAHLDDDARLAAHPLAEQLGANGVPVAGSALRAALLDAVDAAGRDAAPSSVRARQLHQLRLRFVEGLRRDEVARRLGLSLRQATRDLDAAVEAVAAALARERPGTDPASDLAAEASKVAANEEIGADLAEAVRGALTTVANFASQRGVAFETAILDTLPAVALGRTILRQVLIGAFTYAAELAPGGRLVVAATDTAAGVALRVAARGGGPVRGEASAEAMARLEAAAMLLQPRGGAIEAPGQPDGPLVRLRLPPVSLAQVLVVDDNPDLVRLFQRYLGGEPYRLIQATSGEAARRLAAELRPDVVVLDVMLPTEDGWEILAQLRAHPETRDLPVVVCSILPERAVAMSLGVEDFLAKPVTRATLLATLQRWCRPPAAPSARP
jgi:CheY-like chemotaxis protein/predicted DNA-binding protein (UPF0251 family)